MTGLPRTRSEHICLPSKISCIRPFGVLKKALIRSLKPPSGSEGWRGSWPPNKPSSSLHPSRSLVGPVTGRPLTWEGPVLGSTFQEAGPLGPPPLPQALGDPGPEPSIPAVAPAPGTISELY